MQPLAGPYSDFLSCYLRNNPATKPRTNLIVCSIQFALQGLVSQTLFSMRFAICTLFYIKVNGKTFFKKMHYLSQLSSSTYALPSSYQNSLRHFSLLKTCSSIKGVLLWCVGLFFSPKYFRPSLQGFHMLERIKLFPAMLNTQSKEERCRSQQLADLTSLLN